MRIAISIPTYRPHLRHNFEFLRSVVAHQTDDPVPEIFFFTSDDGEKNELEAFCRTLDPRVGERVRVESLAAELAPVLAEDFAGDIDSGFAYGVIGFITFKKFLGLKHVFARGFDHAVILDSEVLQFRTSSLTRSLEREIERDQYRSSVYAYREPWATKVHHDSLRTVVDSYDVNDVFARSYGWYDGLCAFERREFTTFIAEMAGPGTGDEVLRATHRFRGFAFDWVVYQVWRYLKARRTLNFVDLDQCLRAAGVTPRPKPQTENMYLYFTADAERNARVVRALDPPWVPYTRNVDYLAAITAGTPATCCLMFHADRRHAGAGARPSALRRALRRLEPWLRRIARSLLDTPD